MRPRVSWMTEGHQVILEFLDSLGDINGNRVIVRSGTVYGNVVLEMDLLDKSQSTVSRNLRELVNADLVEQVKQGRGTYYRITDKGIAYLDGDLDADELALEE